MESRKPLVKPRIAEKLLPEFNTQMPTYILLFFSGSLLFLCFKQLPCIYLMLLLFVTSILLLILRIKILRYTGSILLGLAYTLAHAFLITHWSLPANLENKPITIEGFITSIPIQQDKTTSFLFSVTKLGGKTSQTKIALRCFQCPYLLHVGETWRFTVKLKKPHSLMDPAVLDAEKYYFFNHIRATGSIIVTKNNLCLSSASQVRIERLRETIQNHLLSEIKGDPFGGIILALTLGLTSYISTNQWQTFRATGTNHLVAISGLHIGLIANLCGKLAGIIWGRIPSAPLYVATIKLEAIVGMFAAIIYGVLAGLSPSTQRALIMIIMMMLATLLKRRLTTFRSLIIALGIIIFLQPFSTLSPGFWLSCLAVFLLIYGLNGRILQKSYWHKWFRPQWVVIIGMMPSVIYLFQQTSLLSFPANIIAIPWFSFLVVPLCLLGVALLPLCKTCGHFILSLALYSLQIIWWLLEKLASFSYLLWQVGFDTQLSVFCGHIAAYMSLLPQGLTSRLLALICCFPLVTSPSLMPPTGSFQLVVFDVGQGLATMVKTAKHTLIFDTGAKLPSTDMGKKVILPYLVQQHIKKIDVLTISHGDNDHIGGASSILASTSVKKIITSVPDRFKPLPVERCVEGKAWQWDEVNFTFLSPSKNSDWVGNNNSCVLRIDNGKQSVLLTGDIEAEAEESLLQRHPKELFSTILVAPHHGSNTSSTAGFLSAVAPQYVVFSCGYLNSYRHPHPAVIERCQKLKIKLLDTVFSGAIIMTLLKDSDKVHVQEYRRINHKIWHQG